MESYFTNDKEPRFRSVPLEGTAHSDRRQFIAEGGVDGP